MFDIVPWFGEVIVAVLAIMIIASVLRLRAYTSEVHATNVVLVPSPTDSALNLKNLSFELATVINWFSLGINLGLPKHELSKIQQSYAHQGNDQQRLEMLYLWLQRTPNATWEDVMRALQQMGENRVAENIREKYIRGRSPSTLEDSGTVEIAQKNKQTIDDKFATLLLNICSKLKGREIDMRQLQLYLRASHPEEDIPNFSDIYEMFGCKKLWNSWDYLLLQKFVEKFAADDAEIASLFEAYKQDLKTYKVTTKLIDYISVAESDCKPKERQHKKSGREYYQEFSVKLGETVADRSLEYIDDLWDALVTVYDLPPHVAILDSIRKGCVSVVWRIPSHIAPKIFEAPPPSEEFYRKHGITRVEYSGESIYQEGKFAVSGPGLTSAITNQVSKFTVHTYDTHGQSTPVSAELKSLVDGSVLQATVVSQTPSTYELSYTPTTRGRHQLTVQVNNTEVGTFQVFVQHPPTQLGTPVRVIEGVNPMFVAVGDKGELFVTEHGNHRYTVLDAQGQTVLTIGSGGQPPFGYGNPTGIATDGEGNVYIASADHKVKKLNRQGELVKSVGKWGKNVGEFNYPFGVRYHNHQVYVCDSGNGRVQVFDSDLNFVRSFGTRGDDPGQFKEPWDIDFDTQGNIYVVDSSEHEVLVFSEDGQYLRHFGQKGQGEGELSCPRGLCVSGDYVYVTELDKNRISVFNTSGEFVHSFGKVGSGRGELMHPFGIAIDQDGFVCVCDAGNNRIQVF